MIVITASSGIYNIVSNAVGDNCLSKEEWLYAEGEGADMNYACRHGWVSTISIGNKLRNYDLMVA